MNANGYVQTGCRLSVYQLHRLRRYPFAAASPQDSTEAPTRFVECQAVGSEEFVDCDADNAEVNTSTCGYFYSPSWSHAFEFLQCSRLFWPTRHRRPVVQNSFAKIRIWRPRTSADCDQTFTQQNDYQPASTTITMISGSAFPKDLSFRSATALDENVRQPRSYGPSGIDTQMATAYFITSVRPSRSCTSNTEHLHDLMD